MRIRIITLLLLLSCVFFSTAFSSVEDMKTPAVQQDQDPLIGQHFLDVQSRDVNGKTHKLSQYAGKGKWVLLDFWASWCGPCQEEMPNVVSAYRKFHDKGFEIVGISLDESKDDWLDAIESWGLSWTHLSDLNGWKCSAVQKYGVDGIPYNVLIGPDGVIQACDLTGNELSEYLSSVLN